MKNVINYEVGSIVNINDIQELLIRMSTNGGSDMFIMGSRPICMKLYSKNVFVTERKLSESEANTIIQEIYGENAKSILGSSIPIDTHYEFKREVKNEDGFVRKKRYRYRVNAVQCQRNGRDSISITLRTIPTTPPSVKDIGVEEELIKVCRNISQGLILIVGATGNGKSTLLASILRDQLEEQEGNRNLVTIESPIEFVYDYIQSPTSISTQLEVGKDIPSFSAGVENSLRMAPSTILVGESRDKETINASITASGTGHVVFSTVHANSVAQTIQRMLSVFPEEVQHQMKFELLQSLKVIVAQRLIPASNGKLVAIRETLIFTDAIKQEILQNENTTQGVTLAVNKYGQSMMTDIKNKFDEGRITQEEFEKQKFNYDQEIKSLHQQKKVT